MKTIGKKFEKNVKDALSEVQRDHGIFFHRFKDSTAAGRIIGNAPADYLVAASGQVQIWEAKSSEVHASLRSCLSNMVDHDQIGYHNIWHFNGLTSYFMFYSDLTGMVEIWNGKTIVEARKAGKPLRIEDMESSCALVDLNIAIKNILNYE